MNQQDSVRCLNKESNKVRFFPRWMCQNISWQRSTGFVPQEIKVVDESQNRFGFMAQGQTFETTLPKKLGRPKKKI